VIGREAPRKLLKLRQDSLSVADYEVDFCTLAAECTWNLEALFDTFLHGLSEEVKDELAVRELLTDLKSLITLTSWTDGRLRERRSDKRSDLRPQSLTQGSHLASDELRKSPASSSLRGSELT
jgi:hypothetical protein